MRQKRDDQLQHLSGVLDACAEVLSFRWGDDATHLGGALRIEVHAAPEGATAAVRVDAAPGFSAAGLPWRLTAQDDRPLASGTTAEDGSIELRATVPPGTAVRLRLSPFPLARRKAAIVEPDWNSLRLALPLSRAAACATGEDDETLAIRIDDGHTRFEAYQSSSGFRVEVALDPEAWGLEDLGSVLEPPGFPSGGRRRGTSRPVWLLRLHAEMAGQPVTTWLLPLFARSARPGGRRASGSAAVRFADIPGLAQYAGASLQPVGIRLKPLGRDVLEREARERPAELDQEFRRSYDLRIAAAVEAALDALRRGLGLAGRY